jgi:hypothetical protein
MFTKEQFIKNIKHETHVCQHLFSKMPPGGLEYRPSLEQRSMLELLQYLTSAVIFPARAILTGDWNPAPGEMEKVKSLKAEQFCEAMDHQCAEAAQMIQGVSEEDLLNKTAQTPMGPFQLGEALVLFPMKFIACYRMQLFLYLKAAGASEIGTYNCWGGMDKPPEAPVGH